AVRDARLRFRRTEGTRLAAMLERARHEVHRGNVDGGRLLYLELIARAGEADDGEPLLALAVDECPPGRADAATATSLAAALGWILDRCRRAPRRRSRSRAELREPDGPGVRRDPGSARTLDAREPRRPGDRRLAGIWLDGFRRKGAPGVGRFSKRPWVGDCCARTNHRERGRRGSRRRRIRRHVR